MPDRPIPGAAADLEAWRRPGVPMEKDPQPLSGSRLPISAQHSEVTVFMHPGRRGMPPVFGTAQPPKGLSGLIRRTAYGFPDHLARRWMLLLFADRVDVWEHRLARLPRWAWPAAGALVVAGIAGRRIARAT